MTRKLMMAHPVQSSNSLTGSPLDDFIIRSQGNVTDSEPKILKMVILSDTGHQRMITFECFEDVTLQDLLIFLGVEVAPGEKVMAAEYADFWAQLFLHRTCYVLAPSSGCSNDFRLAIGELLCTVGKYTHFPLKKGHDVNTTTVERILQYSVFKRL